MLELGFISFATPWVLGTLITLPLIWWLLRVTPPIPKRIQFPAINFLFGLDQNDNTSAHTPWWILLFRLLIATIIILALAEPLLNRSQSDVGGDVVVLVIDDGWASTSNWQERQSAVSGLLEEAARENSPVAFITTAPSARAQLVNGSVSLLTADEAKGEAQGLTPKAWSPDRAAARTQIEALTETLAIDNRSAQVFWFSDGLDYGELDGFAAALDSLGNVTVFAPENREQSLVLMPPEGTSQGFTVSVRRANQAAKPDGQVLVYGEGNRVLGLSDFSFDAGTLESTVEIAMPLELRNRARRIQIAEQRSAGGIALLDDRWQRQLVGLVSNTENESSQPLLSELYYLEKALEPYTELRTGSIETLIQEGATVLVLADIGQIVGTQKDAVDAWVSSGGLLIRFAGPRMAGQTDELLPVAIRQGGRALGGALSWNEPQKMSAFDEQSPFFGLAVSDDVAISKQVLAEPDITLDDRTWARLEDGTPLVTSAPYEDGRTVLFHITANPDWSNLPLSGLYVEMMQRIVSLAGGTTAASGNAAVIAGASTASSYPPLQVLDGFGDLQSPDATVETIIGTQISDIVPGPQHPPGYYGTSESVLAVNTIAEDFALEPIASYPSSFTQSQITSGEAMSFQPLLLTLALIMVFIDGLLALALSGRFNALRVRPMGATVSAIFVATLTIVTFNDAVAQEDADAFAILATKETPLAFVETGNATIDNMSRAGLVGLSRALRDRTAMEPAEPMGVNIETDELSFFPLLYWPVIESQAALSPEALAKVDAFMKNGGTILFDTQDHQTAIPGRSGNITNQTLTRLLAELDIPPLEPVPDEHVLTKAFYLLQDFPGRWSGGRLWVEAGQADLGPNQRLNNDGVSAIIIGSNDYAAAWAEDANGRPIAAVVPGGPRQREFAIRFGVNLVMYTLTGNYKADQVHIPALLERLGQ